MDEKSGEQFALKHKSKILQTHGDTTNDLNLPSLECINSNNHMDLESFELRLNDNVGELIRTLTNAQSLIFNTVIETINEKCNDRLIFIDRPGESIVVIVSSRE